MKLPDAAWRKHEGLDRLAGALGAARGEVRLVGGIVRDALLGLPSADVDLATVHPPEESVRRIAAAGFKAVPTGLAHGTITAVLPSGPVEVTTLRRDIATDGRHARVAFTDDWQADAARRDFTINALSADLADGTVHDYFNGLDDLAAGRVRFIGDPLARIAEDHLRILRFFRFHARFGRGAPETVDLQACVARADDLLALSCERIAQELLKLLGVADPLPSVSLMIGAGVLRPVLPEIGTDGVARLAALIAREAAARGGNAVRRFATLLPPEPATADQIARRLKLSKAQRERLTLAVGWGEDARSPRALAYRIGIGPARDRLLIAGDLAGFRALEGWTPPVFPLSGGTLVALGVPPGPEVTALLREIEARWVSEGFPHGDRARQLAETMVSGSIRRPPPLASP